MKLILTKTVDPLGIVGQEVEVKAGYARNYLLPKKLAVHATQANMKLLAKKRVQWEQKVAKETEQAREAAARMADVTVTLKAKVSEGDKLYGSVNRRDILAALAEQGFVVERKQILLAEPIKSLGEYQVPVRLYKDVEPEITVIVAPQE
ncbi:MAG: 50S ribosomal protein L9 [Proteobacteria bacterium]|nr:50S ribosomal protein L9 [Pseudomonadota bacterium]